MSMSINFMSMNDEYEYQLYEYDWMSMEKAKSFAVDLWCET